MGFSELSNCIHVKVPKEISASVSFGIGSWDLLS